MASTDKMIFNQIADLTNDDQKKQLVEEMKKMHACIIKWSSVLIGKRKSYNRSILKVYSAEGVESNFVEKIEMAKTILSNLRIRIRFGHDPINNPDIYMDAYYSSLEALENDLKCMEEFIYTEPEEVDLPDTEEEIIDNGEE